VARISIHQYVFVAKAKLPQFMRAIGMKVPESLGYDPKPVDLILGKAKCG